MFTILLVVIDIFCSKFMCSFNLRLYLKTEQTPSPSRICKSGITRNNKFFSVVICSHRMFYTNLKKEEKVGKK